MNLGGAAPARTDCDLVSSICSGHVIPLIYFHGEIIAGRGEDEGEVEEEGKYIYYCSHTMDRDKER